MPTPYDTRGKGEGRPDLSRKTASPPSLQRTGGEAARSDPMTVRRLRPLAPAPPRVADQAAGSPPPGPAGAGAGEADGGDAGASPPPTPPGAVAPPSDPSLAPPPPPPTPPPPPVAVAATAPPPLPAARAQSQPRAPAQVPTTTRAPPSILLPPTYLDTRAALSRNPEDAGARRLMERVYTEENMAYMMEEVKKKEGKNRKGKGKKKEEGAEMSNKIEGQKEEMSNKIEGEETEEEGEMSNKIEEEKREGLDKIFAERKAKRKAKRRRVDNDTEDGEERAETASPTVIPDEEVQGDGQTQDAPLQQERPQTHPVDLPDRNPDTGNIATEPAHDITMHDAEPPQQNPVPEPNERQSDHYTRDQLGLTFLLRAVEYVESEDAQASQRPQPLDHHTTPTSSSSPDSSSLSSPPLTPPPPPPPTRDPSACKTQPYTEPTPLPERRPLSQQDPTIPGASRSAFTIHIPLPGLSMPTNKELKDEAGWTKNMLKSGEKDGKATPVEWEVDAVEMGKEELVDRGVRKEARKRARERTRVKALLEGRELGFGFVG